MKTFFEEYGLVLVVIVVVGGMLVVANKAPEMFKDKITEAWEVIVPDNV